jgi:hypothetical protein
MPRGLSTANKGKEQETIIVLETLIDIDLSNLGPRTLDNQNKGNITLNNVVGLSLWIWTKRVWVM